MIRPEAGLGLAKHAEALDPEERRAQHRGQDDDRQRRPEAKGTADLDEDGDLDERGDEEQ